MNNYLKVYTTLIDLERLIKTENLKTAREFGPLSDISHGQGRILAFLKTHEPISIKELAQELRIRPQSLNDHLRRMERDGLIKKEPSLSDKRVVLISLTDEAYEIDLDYKNFESIFDGFNGEELEQFEEYLNRLENNLINELGDESIMEPPRPPHPPKPDMIHPCPPHPPIPDREPPKPPRPTREPVRPYPVDNKRPPEPPFMDEEPYISMRDFDEELEIPIRFNEELKNFVIDTVNELIESMKNEGLTEENHEE